MAFQKYLGSLLFLLHLSTAAVLPLKSDHQKRCINSAEDRSCWGEYDLSTNFYTTFPDTGNTCEYTFNIQNGTFAPDGVSRDVLTINGQYPGPTIECNWGDTVVVNVKNNLETNGTSIHFHGIRQLQNSQNDGVPSITQCPIAPGDTMTYTWKAQQYGTTWYHSHFELQAWDGVTGGIIIHGPASANYDVDLGTMLINEWTHATSASLLDYARTHGPFDSDTGLINGTNVWESGGSRFTTTFAAGKSYLIRLVNVAIDTHFKFSIDNHTLTLIATDLVPINPVTVDVLSIGIAQRYDIIVTANQNSSNYWLRAVPATACSGNNNGDDIKGIIRYDASSSSDPTSTAYSAGTGCEDQPTLTSMEPVLALDAGSASVTQSLDAGISRVNNIFYWTVNSTSFVVSWENPTLVQIHNDQSFQTSNAVISLPVANEWVYLVIESTLPITHPIHLHGHDFYVLAQSTGTYSSSVTLNTTNPVRRDVAMLPAQGYLVISFLTDNPGACCHIGWHTLEGLAVQFVERRSEIDATLDFESMNSTCAKWNTYNATSATYVQTDSGI